MSKRADRLERQLTRLAPGPARPRRKQIRFLGLKIGGPALFIAWLLPGVPPPGPFG